MHKIFSATIESAKAPTMSKKVLIGQSMNLPDTVWEEVLPDLQNRLQLILDNTIKEAKLVDIVAEGNKKLNADMIYLVFNKNLSIGDYNEAISAVKAVCSDMQHNTYNIQQDIAILPATIETSIPNFYKVDLQFWDDYSEENNGNYLPESLKRPLKDWVEFTVANEFDLPIRQVTLTLERYAKDGFPLVINSRKEILKTKLYAFIREMNKEFTVTYPFPIRFVEAV